MAEGLLLVRDRGQVEYAIRICHALTVRSHVARDRLYRC